MNFILLTDNFHPTINSGSIIMGDLARELADSGNNIIVITFVDNQADKIQDSVDGSIRVVRIRTRLRKYGMVGRLISEMTYSSKIKRLLRSKKEMSCDAVICYSPSIFFGNAVKYIKNEFNVSAYLILRDIFPKWVVDAGIIGKGLLYKFFKYIELNLYRSVDLIGIESRSDINYFLEYVDERKVEVLNNWGSALDHDEIGQTSIQNYIDTEKVNIVYGGNMGDAQDLLSLVKTIDTDILADKAVITLLGSGNQAKDIAGIIKSRNIDNIKIFSAVERSIYLELLLNSDAGIVSLSKKLGSNNFPLKMMGYIQLSKPILASVNESNEIIDLINRNNIGLVSLAGDADAFNKNLERIINSPDLRIEQGGNALELFNREFTVQSAANQILKGLSTI